MMSEVLIRRMDGQYDADWAWNPWKDGGAAAPIPVERDAVSVVAELMTELSAAYQRDTDGRVSPVTIPVIRELLSMSRSERDGGGLTRTELSDRVGGQQVAQTLIDLPEVVALYSGGRLEVVVRKERDKRTVPGQNQLGGFRYRLRWAGVRGKE